MPRDKKNEPGTLFGAIALSVLAVASVGLGYLLGKEEGREEAREQSASSSSSSSSRTRTRPGNNQTGGAGAGAGGDGFTHPRVVNLDGSPYNGRLEGQPAASASASATSSPSSTDEDAHLCKVCLAAPNDHVFLDCHHQACCGDCASQMKQCPICQRKIRKIIRVYKS